MNLEVRLLLRCQSPDCHARAEIGAADADVDDVGDVLAGKAAPFATVNFFTELLHAFEHGTYFGRFLLVGAQGHVADGAILGVVDRLAGQHFLLPALEVGSFSKGVEQG